MFEPKYRIKKLEKEDGTVEYYPQYSRLLFFWHSMDCSTPFQWYSTKTSSIDTAKYVIQNHKLEMAKKKIRTVTYITDEI